MWTVIGDFSWADLLAILDIAVPFVAFVWEFIIVGRKRLGYRVQMDTLITTGGGQHQAQGPDALTELHGPDGTRLRDPSLVLVRIENSGMAHLVEDDYLSKDVGIQLEFPERTVAAARATEISDPVLYGHFRPDLGPGNAFQGREY